MCVPVTQLRPEPWATHAHHPRHNGCDRWILRQLPYYGVLWVAFVWRAYQEIKSLAPTGGWRRQIKGCCYVEFRKRVLVWYLYMVMGRGGWVCRSVRMGVASVVEYSRQAEDIDHKWTVNQEVTQPDNRWHLLVDGWLPPPPQHPHPHP